MCLYCQTERRSFLTYSRNVLDYLARDDKPRHGRRERYARRDCPPYAVAFRSGVRGGSVEYSTLSRLTPRLRSS